MILTIPRKGYRLIPQVGPVMAVRPQMFRRYMITSAGLCALLGGAITCARFRPAPPPIHSLAVLPLKNLSGDSGQQYFVDGLTDELTSDSARLGNLRVIYRTSAMVYADTNKPLPQIARELNVVDPRLDPLRASAALSGVGSSHQSS